MLQIASQSHRFLHSLGTCKPETLAPVRLVCFNARFYCCKPNGCIDRGYILSESEAAGTAKHVEFAFNVGVLSHMSSAFESWAWCGPLLQGRWRRFSESCPKHRVAPLNPASSTRLLHSILRQAQDCIAPLQSYVDAGLTHSCLSGLSRATHTQDASTNIVFR